jgi:putative intracellular protease/amidase
VNTTKNSVIFAVAITSLSLWAAPSHAQASAQINFTGTVLQQCAFIAANNTPVNGKNVSVELVGNTGSISTVCNTPSTLSVTIDKTASTIDNPNAEIRFAPGGTGVYTNAHQNSNYAETATFRNQGSTSATGDTANVEVNTTPQPNQKIVVGASLTP